MDISENEIVWLRFRFLRSDRTKGYSPTVATYKLSIDAWVRKHIHSCAKPKLIKSKVQYDDEKQCMVDEWVAIYSNGKGMVEMKEYGKERYHNYRFKKSVPHINLSLLPKPDKEITVYFQ